MDKRTPAKLGRTLSELSVCFVNGPFVVRRGGNCLVERASPEMIKLLQSRTKIKVHIVKYISDKV